MKKLMMVSLIVLGGSQVFAKQYGEAGCGLGSVLMGKSGNQVIASTTNGSSYTNLFGISSGTSNCTDDGVVKSSKKVPMFIESNSLALQKESSRGSGESINSLAQLVNCESTALGPAMKQHYRFLFVDSKMEPAKIEQNLQQIIDSNPKQVCGKTT